MFGSDRVSVRACLESAGNQAFLESDAYDSLEFPIASIPEVQAAFPQIEICLCTSIAEFREGAPAIRERALAKLT